MRSQPFKHLSEVEGSPPSGEDALGEVTDDENPNASDREETPYLQTIRVPPRIQAPPRCPSISTTISEVEIEHGESLLQVKRARVKGEELDDVLADPEDVLSDESEKPAPKKRKTRSTGTKKRSGKTKKPGMKTYTRR